MLCQSDQSLNLDSDRFCTKASFEELCLFQSNEKSLKTVKEMLFLS